MHETHGRGESGGVSDEQEEHNGAQARMGLGCGAKASTVTIEKGKRRAIELQRLSKESTLAPTYP